MCAYACTNLMWLKGNGGVGGMWGDNHMQKTFPHPTLVPYEQGTSSTNSQGGAQEPPVSTAVVTMRVEVFIIFSATKVKAIIILIKMLKATCYYQDDEDSRLALRLGSIELP